MMCPQDRYLYDKRSVATGQPERAGSGTVAGLMRSAGEARPAYPGQQLVGKGMF
jgi:hypothetical protein